MHSYSIKDLAGIVLRANLANESALEVLLARIRDERDQIRETHLRMAECLHASALILRAIPEFSEELQRDMQQMAARVIRSVAKSFATIELSEQAAKKEEKPTPIRTLNEMAVGGILIELGIVDQADIDAGLERARATGKPLGEALVELGRAAADDIRNAVELQKVLSRSASSSNATPETPTNAVGDLLLGEIMLRSERIDEHQLARALQLQRERGIRVGEALIEIGAATWTDVTEAIREQVRRRGGSEAAGSAV